MTYWVLISITPCPSINPIEFWYIFDLRSGWPDQVDILGGENRTVRFVIKYNTMGYMLM